MEVDMFEFLERIGPGHRIFVPRKWPRGQMNEWLKEYVEGNYYIDFFENTVGFENEYEAVAFRFVAQSFAEE